jgi:hypothetical protein
MGEEIRHITVCEEIICRINGIIRWDYPKLFLRVVCGLNELTAYRFLRRFNRVCFFG